MRQQDMRRLLALVERLTRVQRQELLDKLKAQATASEAIELVESMTIVGASCARNGSAARVRKYTHPPVRSSMRVRLAVKVSAERVLLWQRAHRVARRLINHIRPKPTAGSLAGIGAVPETLVGNLQ